MKKIILTVLIISVSSISYAQTCIPEWSGTEYGITPDTLINLPPAYEGEPYSATINFRVPLDTSVKVGLVKFKAKVNYIRIDSGKGLDTIPSIVPFKDTYNPASKIFKGDSLGCIYVTGTPAFGSAGIYKLTVYATANAHVNILNKDFDEHYTIPFYRIVVNTNTTVEGIKRNEFSLLPNYPNPAGNTTRINYYIPSSALINLKIFSVLGQLILDKNIRSDAGLNSINIDLENIQSGQYFYSISYNENRLTSRLNIIR